MRKKRKRKKTKIGNKLALLAVVLLALAPSLVAAKKKKALETYGLIGVTVFREPGFAVAGAEVILTPAPEPGGSVSVKDTLKEIAGARGEVVFRVPAAAMRYKVRASSKGLAAQEKTVSIEGEQRIDVTFMLIPESK